MKEGKDIVHIIIQNEGQGILESEMPLRLQKYKNSVHGPAGESSSGLGLSIVKVLVDSLGGNIHCSSIVNKVTTFTVKIPLNSL